MIYNYICDKCQGDEKVLDLTLGIGSNVLIKETMQFGHITKIITEDHYEVTITRLGVMSPDESSNHLIDIVDVQRNELVIPIEITCKDWRVLL